MRGNAEVLLHAVNALLDLATASGQVDLEINPATGCLVSGNRDGGWRPLECATGAPPRPTSRPWPWTSTTRTATWTAGA